MRKLQDKSLGNVISRAGLVIFGVVAFMVLAAATSRAQPANDLFLNALSITGANGTTNGTNIGATAEPGEPDHADNPGGPYATVWYQWTAQNDGVRWNLTQKGSSFDTEIATYIYTGTNAAAVTNLTLVAQNEDVNFPSDLTSKVTFTVTAGMTYYIAVDGYEGAEGAVTLNWNAVTSSVNAGQFQFASSRHAGVVRTRLFIWPAMTRRRVGNLTSPISCQHSPARMTVTRVGGHAGHVQVYYQVTNTYYTNLVFTNVFGTNFFTTNGAFFTNIFYTNIEVINVLQQMAQDGNFINTRITNDTAIYGTNQDSKLNSLTVTNVGTNFTYFCHNVSLLSTNTNASPPIVTYTNYFCTNYPAFTNLIPTATFGQDYSTPGGVLDFRDYQMSADITGFGINRNSRLSPFFTKDNQGPFYLNRLLVVNITNVVFDPQETTNIGAPTISTTMGTAYMNVLDSGAIGTNVFYGNSGDIWNFDHVTYRLLEGNNPVARVWISWSGTNNGPPASETLTYRLDFGTVPDNNHGFPLLPGSEYATPPGSAPGSSQPADFTDTSGSFTWTPNVPYFDIPITNDSIVEFNEDIWMNLHASSTGTLGQVTNATMTILFKDQPAGAKDENYFPPNSPFTTPAYVTKTGADAPVYAIAIQPADGKAIVAGSFFQLTD